MGNRSSKQAELVEIAVKVIALTERAVLINDGAAEVWLPLAQIEISNVDKDNFTTVTMPQWLAEEKGLV